LTSHSSAARAAAPAKRGAHLILRKFAVLVLIECFQGRHGVLDLIFGEHAVFVFVDGSENGVFGRSAAPASEAISALASLTALTAGRTSKSVAALISGCAASALIKSAAISAARAGFLTLGQSRSRQQRKRDGRREKYFRVFHNSCVDSDGVNRGLVKIVLRGGKKLARLKLHGSEFNREDGMKRAKVA
jgi:hypothetical protein